MKMTTLVGIWSGLAAVTACSEEASEPPPIAEVEATVEAIAVNTSSIFLLDASDSTVIELGLDGSMIGKLPSTAAVSAIAAQDGWVAWIEPEGSGKIIRRRKTDGAVESRRATTADPRILATAEGLFYSDGSLVAIWMEGMNPDRVATAGDGASVVGVDATYVYTVEADTSVLKYPRTGEMAESLLPTSKDAVVKDGSLAHRTTEGIRERDLLTGFDRVVGAPPADYPCPLLIAGRAVMCGKYRAMDGMITELLEDPVGGYAAVGKEVVWVKRSGGKSSIYRVDAELTE